MCHNLMNDSPAVERVGCFQTFADININILKSIIVITLVPKYHSPFQSLSLRWGPSREIARSKDINISGTLHIYSFQRCHFPFPLMVLRCLPFHRSCQHWILLDISSVLVSKSFHLCFNFLFFHYWLSTFPNA